MSENEEGKPEGEGEDQYQSFVPKGKGNGKFMKDGNYFPCHYYKTKKIHIANEKPRIGETVYSLSAPLGIASDFTRMKFRGSWAGCDSDLTNEDYCYYTIPAAPGSSGSGVFNQYGELVSILSIAMTGFEFEIYRPPPQLGAHQKDVADEWLAEPDKGSDG